VLKNREVFRLADLSQSVFSSLGLTGVTNYLEIPSSLGREVLFLLDGFGSFIFEDFKNEIPAIMASQSYRDLQSHFPSTTVTNLSSLGTGSYPDQHGMVGYTMRIPFAQPQTPQLLNGLKWDQRIDPLTWQRIPTLFERGLNQGISVNHIAARRYEGSGFTQAALRGARYFGAHNDEEIIDALKAALASERSFTYLYLNDVDDAGHGAGIGSEKWIHALRRVDNLFEKIMKSIPAGTRIWLTADHGMINVGKKITLGEGNNLLQGIELLGGEPRARHLYIKPEDIDQVKQRWFDFFGDRIELFTPVQGFGEEMSASIAARVGDLIAVPKDKSVLIEPERKNLQSQMVGHHGGVSEEELAIPLRSWLS
jgi:hypothetical protein